MLDHVGFAVSDYERSKGFYARAHSRVAMLMRRRRVSDAPQGDPPVKPL